MIRLCRSTIAVIVLLLGSTIAFSQVSHRPIEDFINRQSTLWYWYDSARPERLVLVDFAGVRARWLAERGVDLGTYFEGAVSERPLPDGRTLVHVVLHGKWVFVRGFVMTEAGDQTVFGCTRDEALTGGAPGLGDILYTLTFITDAEMGAPLPDKFAVHWPESESLVVRAEGPLRPAFGVPDGTPGFLQLTQVSLTPGNRVSWGEFWPAEHIHIGVIEQ